MATPNYVKFSRGSIQAYEHLIKKDDNTLYFIYDNEDQTKGKLYLGTRLISSNVGSNSDISLADLTDTLITSVNAGDFLIANSEGKWIPVSAADVAQTIIEANGNFVSIDENEFNFNSVNGQLELKGFNAASTGMIPVKENNNLNWVSLPPDLTTSVGNLETEVSQLKLDFQDIDNKIANAISGSNHLTYTVISDLAEATENNTVYLYSNGSEDTSNMYDEYMLVNGNLEKIGTYGINLDNYVTNVDFNNAINTINPRLTALENANSNFMDTYVTKVTFNNTVGDLSQLSDYNNLDYSTASISDTFEDIYSRLIWQEITS